VYIRISYDQKSNIVLFHELGVFTDLQVTTSSGNLFHLSTVVFEKNYIYQYAVKSVLKNYVNGLITSSRDEIRCIVLSTRPIMYNHIQQIKYIQKYTRKIM